MFGYLLESPLWGDSNKYSKHLFYGKIKIQQSLSYISFCSLRILYNSKFILMATFLYKCCRCNEGSLYWDDLEEDICLQCAHAIRSALFIWPRLSNLAHEIEEHVSYSFKMPSLLTVLSKAKCLLGTLNGSIGNLLKWNVGRPAIEATLWNIYTSCQSKVGLTLKRRTKAEIRLRKCAVWFRHSFFVWRLFEWWKS